MSFDLFDLFDIYDIIDEVDEYTFTDKNLFKKLSDEIKNNDINELAFHDKNLIEKYKSYVAAYHNIKNNNDINNNVCCICIDEHTLEDNIYFKCKHFVCRYCFDMAKMSFGLSTCPLCRVVIDRCIYNDKYAIVALGIETKFNTFENGGYKNISVAYIPEYLGVKSVMIDDIKYYDGNKAKEDFEIHLFTLMTDGYIIVFQNYKKIKVWLSDILLKDFIYNDSILHD